MFDLKTYLASKREKIDRALGDILNADSSRIAKAMSYSLMAGGKRLRPVLCVAASEAVGGSMEDVLEAACALEIIHTYSLIHDDLPAMDDDALRRGKPTCHVAFDEATAILAGDGLLTLAFEVLASGGCKGTLHSGDCKGTLRSGDCKGTLRSGNIEGKKPALLLAAMSRIAQAAGYQGMIEGQMRDIASEGKSLDQDELGQMHALKTGALIRASVYCGALLGGGTSDQIGQLDIYAKHVGLAFQVVDDILNVEGDPAIMGKATGSDETRGKNTYPSIIGLGASKKLAETLTESALEAILMFDGKADPLRAIAKYIIERKQ